MLLRVIILLVVVLVLLIPVSKPNKAFRFSSFYAAFLTCLFFLNLQNHIESQIMFLPFICMKPLGEDGGTHAVQHGMRNMSTLWKSSEGNA